MDSLRATDDAVRQVQKTPNRVSLDSIKDKIEHVDYYHPDRHPHMTICLLTLENGYVVTGESAPADPSNYDEALGMQLAYENAVRKIWPLEGYLLCDRIAFAAAASSIDVDASVVSDTLVVTEAHRVDPDAAP